MAPPLRAPSKSRTTIQVELPTIVHLKLLFMKGLPKATYKYSEEFPQQSCFTPDKGSEAKQTMSTTSTSPLSAGVQQIYNAGLLPSGLSNSTLNGASASQLNSLVGSEIASQQISTLLGTGTDSASLSSTATNSLLQEINPTATTSSTTTDPFSAAITNALTSNIDAAVNKFATPTTTSGTNINEIG